MNRINLCVSLSSIALAVAILAACGGGGSSSSADAGAPVATAAGVTVATYITDNLATEYAQVWVGVLKLAVVNTATGVETVLFESATPTVYNLSSLASVGQLMSTVKLPAGVYGRLLVTLDSAVQLVSLDGKTTTNAKLRADGSPVTVPVKLEFDTAAPTPIVIDFNLAKFSYDAATGLVAPTLEKKDPAQPFMREQARARGALVSVAADGFVMDDKRLGAGLKVKLAADAVILDEASKRVLALTDLGVGSTIEAKGRVAWPAVAGEPLTLTASVIRVVETAREQLPAAQHFSGGEGKVTAIAGTRLTVALSEANFVPGSSGNSVVVDTAKAVYTHGAATDIALGTSVEFRGQLDAAGVMQALFVDVEGAASKNDREGHPNGRFADLAVTVVSVSGTTLIVTANPGEGQAGSLATRYTIDFSKAEIKSWGASCLTAGQKLRVKGALTGTTMTALVIEVVGACTAPVTPPVPPLPAASGVK